MTETVTVKESEAIKALRKLGLEVVHDDRWVGTPGKNRRSILTERIRSVLVPLTPKEWCDLCMCEGEGYIGGCCGQSGHTQDILNSIFRAGGWVDACKAWEMRRVAAGHDGHEILTEKNEKKVAAEVAKWKTLHGFQKVMLCVRAALPQMRSWAGSDSPFVKTGMNDAKEAIRALYEGSGYLDLKDFFASKDSPDLKNGQDHGNTTLRVARVVPAAKKFLELAAPVLGKAFSGFAVVDKKNEIAKNGYGLTVYHEKSEARSIISSWKKNERARGKNADKKRLKQLSELRIRPCRISIENGLELL